MQNCLLRFNGVTSANRRDSNALNRLTRTAMVPGSNLFLGKANRIDISSVACVATTKFINIQSIMINMSLFCSVNITSHYFYIIQMKPTANRMLLNNQVESRKNKVVNRLKTVLTMVYNIGNPKVSGHYPP